jgi:hypothetical protein
MDSITIYPKNEKQKSLLKSLLEEMKVRFEMGRNDDDMLLTEKEYVAKIDKSLQQAALGETKKLDENQQREFLGL